MTFDLDAYFSRIGLDPKGLSGAELLFAAHGAHARSIPFECLDPFRDMEVSLAPEALFDKMVTRRRGGYCFEQNGLFYLAAKAMGFDIEGRIARVSGPDSFGPQLHRMNVARVDGKTYVCDVGYGGDCFVEPLLLENGLEQERGLETYRMADSSQVDHSVQIRRGDKFCNLLGFLDVPSPDADFDVGNFYTSKNPASFFRSHIMCALATSCGRVTLFDTHLTIREKGKPDEHVELPRDISPALAEYFGLDAPGIVAPEPMPFPGA